MGVDNEEAMRHEDRLPDPRWHFWYLGRSSPRVRALRLRSVHLHYDGEVMSDLAKPQECAEWIRAWEGEIRIGKCSAIRWLRMLGEALGHMQHGIAHCERRGLYVEMEHRKQSLEMLTAAKQRATG